MVLVDAVGLPPELRRLTVPFDIGWPDEEELTEVVRSTFQRGAEAEHAADRVQADPAELEHLVQMFRGLTSEEAARRGFRRRSTTTTCWTRSDLPQIMDAKRNLLGTLGCLESITADVSPDEMGGLKQPQAVAQPAPRRFSARAREFGLDPPRGMLLLGVQGCGKSLCAKVVASAWRMPLLRMDPGVLYQKFIGESEARLREALRQAESMAPVVLWIDEIEKAFASAGSDSADGGLSQRMFGTLLTWMQDHRQPIFLIATANNIAQLPPELMRKGRFDEIFFVDLPGPAEREAIFAIHLASGAATSRSFDIARLVAASDGFTGAEIEQAIISGLYLAFSANSRMHHRAPLAAMQATQPLSVLMREHVEHLRAWAHCRCVPAD